MTARDLALCAALAALTAVCAQLSVTLPWVSSVPFTLQVFAVVLAGASLGARLGFVSQLLYLLLGAAGLPVFAQLRGGLSVLVGPTAGYLWAFPVAAALAGWAAGPMGSRPAGGGRLVAGAVLAVVPVYALGALWLSISGVAPGLRAAVQVGVLPFVVPDLVKAALASLVAVRVRAAAEGFVRR
ncbi:MAG: biotin transporter BioY [Armatimonadota bacterium]|nr:biotin transporter BioY [Armatimonadota bacterium]MDR7388128.1 biotin transporter BioY [Armatimonadota bacterium]MDR7392922.1 biotin transporter BioY [Armatimonadota bacterium]MDR7395317.1 biotin transporter BioY [Armatimonadota bacterium]MDR7398040.1 biotin transporter BioY [Armatimonadota bacterium]